MSAVTLETLRANFNDLSSVSDCEAARVWLTESMEPLFDDLKHCQQRRLSPRRIRSEIEHRKNLKWEVSHLNARIKRDEEEKRLADVRIQRLQCLTPDQLMAEQLAEKRAQYAFEAERARIKHEQKMDRINANNAPHMQTLKALKQAIISKYGSKALAELLASLPNSGCL